MSLRGESDRVRGTEGAASARNETGVAAHLAGRGMASQRDGRFSTFRGGFLRSKPALRGCWSACRIWKDVDQPTGRRKNTGTGREDRLGKPLQACASSLDSSPSAASGKATMPRIKNVGFLSSTLSWAGSGW